MRPLTRGDFPQFAEWLASPHVARWWREPATSDWVEREYGPHVDGDPRTEAFIAEYDGTPIGLVQRYRHREYPEWRAAVGVDAAAGIDYLIGAEDLTGRGLGTDMIRRATLEALDAYPDVQAICAVTDQENVASWRALEKAGFRRVRAVEKLVSDHPSDQRPSFVYVFERA